MDDHTDSAVQFAPPPANLPPPWEVPTWQGYRPYQPPPRPGANGYAIASFVLSLLWLGGIGSVLAIVFGHIARDRRHDWRGDGHRRMALAGLILGYVGVGVAVVLIATGSFYTSSAGSSASPLGPAGHTAAAAKTDVEAVATKVTVYYDESTGPLSLTSSGRDWKLTSRGGRVVGQGKLASAEESVISNAIDGASTWCIALGSHTDDSKTWSVNAEGDVINASCPPNLIYA